MNHKVIAICIEICFLAIGAFLIAFGNIYSASFPLIKNRWGDKILCSKADNWETICGVSGIITFFELLIFIISLIFK